MNTANPWERFKRCLCTADSIGLSLDISRMNFPDAFFDRSDQHMRQAFDEMASLEAGAIANPDESRMVGHYWLRAPELAPTDDIRAAIVNSIADIHAFAEAVHDGDIRPPKADRFRRILAIGIGGSALGPQFVTDALGGSADKMTVSFCDNTDPDGIDRTLASIGSELNETLILVTSKSGGTKETRNAMLEVRHAYEAAGLSFNRHAVAITGSSGALHELADAENWLKKFLMWDWVGGRTSQMSAVGLVPAALQGYDIDAMLAGAAACDAATRVHEVVSNPAALLALMWYHAGGGTGTKDMVIMPYKDRLALLSHYLQQLVMESLGKKLDRDGRVVHQGITVYGHKGSSDQHAYVQQLRDGLDNFFVTFIEVLRDRRGQSIHVDDDATSGDYLHGFFLGTRQALHDAGRESITITIDEVSARSIGVLIALFERAVGFYATLINVNAYNQPGVEAGKQAAEHVLALQRRLLSAMRAESPSPRTAEQWSTLLGAVDEVETVFKILNHLAANPYNRITRNPAPDPFAATYSLELRTRGM